MTASDAYDRLEAARRAYAASPTWENEVRLNRAIRNYERSAR